MVLGAFVKVVSESQFPGDERTYLELGGALAVGPSLSLLPQI